LLKNEILSEKLEILEIVFENIFIFKLIECRPHFILIGHLLEQKQKRLELHLLDE
jgi:hypothetical protein